MVGCGAPAWGMMNAGLRVILMYAAPAVTGYERVPLVITVDKTPAASAPCKSQNMSLKPAVPVVRRAGMDAL